MYPSAGNTGLAYVVIGQAGDLSATTLSEATCLAVGVDLATSAALVGTGSCHGRQVQQAGRGPAAEPARCRRSHQGREQAMAMDRPSWAEERFWRVATVELSSFEACLGCSS